MNALFNRTIIGAVDMAPQPIRCLWSGDNKHLKKKKEKKKRTTIDVNHCSVCGLVVHLIYMKHHWIAW